MWFSVTITRSHMGWFRRYHIRNYIRGSAWLIPASAIPIALVALVLSRWLDDITGWKFVQLSTTGVTTLLLALVPASLTFIALILSMLLLAVQLASSQFSPRLIGGLLSLPVVKRALFLLVFDFVYSSGTLARADKQVPQLPGLIAVLGSMVALVAALFLIDYIAKELRPVRMLARTAAQGREVIDEVYPCQLPSRPTAEQVEPAPPTEGGVEAVPYVGVPYLGRANLLLAVDLDGLLKIAEKANRTIEIAPQVGDLVVTGEPLFRIYPDLGEVSPPELHNHAAFGHERTADQDPRFAFRILVDVACKALSPAINDPTTATLAIDQIHYLLRVLGRRDLDTGELRDSKGNLRVVIRMPDWDSFVMLGVTEIRHYGASSIQTARRLRAMLENLMLLLPPSRTAALGQQLRLLRSAVERSFVDKEDQLIAEGGDTQGVGG